MDSVRTPLDLMVGRNDEINHSNDSDASGFIVRPTTVPTKTVGGGGLI